MELDRRTCDRARRSRDARFDGRFFIGVTSTRVYCRPICPARAPKDEHIRYFPTAAAAESAGFRPCLRCRPEASPGTPAWIGTSALVSRAMRLIGDGALDDDGVTRLAERLGVTDRHLRRLFLQHLGATPLEVALTRRVHFAKKLLDETTLAFGQIAAASGFGSLRRFNGQVRRTFSRTPTELRKLARQRAPTGGECYRFRLAYRPPYDWDALLSYLGAHAIPGVEAVDPSRYRRTIAVDGKSGLIEVARAESGSALILDVHFPDPRALLLIVERVRRLFDLGADPVVIREHLGGDPLLRAPLMRYPGIRVPGAWDGFERAVQIILGRSLSIREAAAAAGRVAAMFGSRRADSAEVAYVFPAPTQVANAPLERVGVPTPHADTIRALARRVKAGTITLDTGAVTRTMRVELEALPGLTRSMAEYLAMCAQGEPDTFPSGDLGLRRTAGGLSARELERRSESWRPWRAYAAMVLWWDAERKTRRSVAQQKASRPGRTAA